MIKPNIVSTVYSHDSFYAIKTAFQTEFPFSTSNTYESTVTLNKQTDKAVNYYLLKDIADKIKNLFRKDPINHINFLSYDKQKNPYLSHCIIVWDDKVVFLNDVFRPYIQVMAKFKDDLIKINDTCLELSPKETNTGTLYVITATAKDIELNEFGKIDTFFNKENYTEDVINFFYDTKKELIAKEACGNLFVIEGPPGTGKTHIIKSLVTEVKECCFVLVSKEVVKLLSNPSNAMKLADFKRTKAVDKSLVLLLEDADEFLLKREKTEPDAISNFLNLSDGIIGQILDMKIIVTSNGSHIDMDAAVLRSGRLNSRIHVGNLPAHQANSIYQREANTDDEPFADSTSLADIYAFVHRKYDDSKLKILNKKQKKIGF